MYIEASSPRTDGHYAHFASEVFKVNPQFNWCVSFYFHMYGLSAATLLVESLYTPSWSRGGRKYYRRHKTITGNHGNDWHWMQVDISQSYNFQVSVHVSNSLDETEFTDKCSDLGSMIVMRPSHVLYSLLRLSANTGEFASFSVHSGALSSPVIAILTACYFYY